MDYFGARYYSSGQGRFTSPDEFNGGPVEFFAAAASSNPTFYADIIDPQTLNKYQYALNNSLNYVDPDGHQERKTLTEQARQAAARVWESTGGRLFGNNEKSPREEASDRPNIGPGGPLPSTGELVTRTNRVAGDAMWEVGNLISFADPSGVTSFAGTVLKYQQGKADDKELMAHLATTVGGAVFGVRSMIGGDKVLTKLAQESGGVVQKSVDNLAGQLGKGNLNPGIGTKHLAGNIYYARSDDGARVFFRAVKNGIEILGKGYKQNEQQVINRVLKVFGGK